MLLSEIQAFLQKLCAPVAFVSNSILVHLILTRSPKNLGVYKYLMIYISIFEIIYALLDIIASPDMYSYDTMFLVVFRKQNRFVPDCAVNFVSTMFCSMFGMSQVIFTIHFVYRYLVVSRGSNFLNVNSFWKMSIWFLSPAFVGVIWGVLVVTTLNENSFTDAKLKESYLPARNLTLESVFCQGPNYFITNAKGVEQYNWRVIVGMACLIAIIGSSMLVIVSLAILTYHRIGSLVNVVSSSQQYRAMQTEILNALVGQALIPALLMLAPSCLIFIAPFFHEGSRFPGGILGITICLYPALDPLPTMFIIKHYRKALFSKFEVCSNILHHY